MISLTSLQSLAASNPGLSPPLAKCPFYNAVASLPGTGQVQGGQMDAGMSHHYVNSLHTHPPETSFKATAVQPSSDSIGPRAEHEASHRSADESGTWTLCSTTSLAQLFFLLRGVGCVSLKHSNEISGRKQVMIAHLFS